MRKNGEERELDRRVLWITADFYIILIKKLVIWINHWNIKVQHELSKPTKAPKSNNPLLSRPERPKKNATPNTSKKPTSINLKAFLSLPIKTSSTLKFPVRKPFTWVIQATKQSESFNTTPKLNPSWLILFRREIIQGVRYLCTQNWTTQKNRQWDQAKTGLTVQRKRKFTKAVMSLTIFIVELNAFWNNFAKGRMHGKSKKLISLKNFRNTKQNLMGEKTQLTSAPKLSSHPDLIVS